MNSKMIVLAALLIVFASSTEGLACSHRRTLRRNPSRAGRSVENNPHAPHARHPREVARVLRLLPEIPASASHTEVIEMLGLPPDWDGGSVSSTHCIMVWDLAPGYRFELSFDPVYRDDEMTLQLAGAGFAARGKPGFAPDEYHTIYPYHTWKGMLQE